MACRAEEGRGSEPNYLITMFDDATSRLLARFVPHDSTEENMKLVELYLNRFGRPAITRITGPATLVLSRQIHQETVTEEWLDGQIRGQQISHTEKGKSPFPTREAKFYRAKPRISSRREVKRTPARVPDVLQFVEVGSKHTQAPSEGKPFAHSFV